MHLHSFLFFAVPSTNGQRQSLAEANASIYESWPAVDSLWRPLQTPTSTSAALWLIEGHLSRNLWVFKRPPFAGRAGGTRSSPPKQLYLHIQFNLFCENCPETKNGTDTKLGLQLGLRLRFELVLGLRLVLATLLLAIAIISCIQVIIERGTWPLPAILNRSLASPTRAANGQMKATNGSQHGDKNLANESVKK